MKRNERYKWCVLLVTCGSLLLGAVGCDRSVAGEIATVSGSYLGEIVTVVTTGYMRSALGVEGGPEAAESMHDHEH